MQFKGTLTYVGSALALLSWLFICYVNFLATSSSSNRPAKALQVAAKRMRSGEPRAGEDDSVKQVKHTFIGDEELKATMEQIQSERQQTLRAACGATDWQQRPAYETIRPKFYRTVNVPSLELTYCAVAKCATTTFKGFLAQITGNPCYDRMSGGICTPRNLTHPRSFEDFRRNSLLIVRNPWSRVVSTYWDKFVVERHRLASSCYERHHKPLRGSKAVTFAEYVGCVLDDYRRKVPLDVHSAPIHWHCSPCQANYTYIAHLETFKDDFRYLSRHVFPKGTSPEEYDQAVAASKPRKNEAANMTAASYFDCYRSLSRAATDGLVALYRADAEYYGYPSSPL